MLPTPSTSHVETDYIYEPAEDSYLFLDTLSSAAEIEFLTHRFNNKQCENAPNPSPLIVEVGTGSGIVLAFVTAQAKAIFGRDDLLPLGTDLNLFACRAAMQTVVQACKDANTSKDGASLASSATSLCADLTNPLRSGVADMLIFNPPYVPSDNVPRTRPVIFTDRILSHAGDTENTIASSHSDLLAMSYAGGLDGMEVTNMFLEDLPRVLNRQRGVAYILLCQQNRPEQVVQRIRLWGKAWNASIVGRSGKQAGWEKLAIIRIWRN